MAHRTSYSQNKAYIDCPRYWDLYYNEKWRAEKEGASLYFGSAVDFAVTAMLEGKDNYIEIFLDRWDSAIVNNKPYPIFDNEDIIFANADFDADILNVDDRKDLVTWVQELKLMHKCSEDQAIALFKDIQKAKRNKYQHINATELKYFNRCSWLSLRRKGVILIEAFKEQFYPKITKVIATQERADLKDARTGDSIVGFIDMVLEIEGYDKPIIFDLKTSSQPYTDQHINLTEQLTLYAAMKAYEYQTDLVGYVVLCKNIPKISKAYCTVCGHVKTGRHKTCDNEVNGARCNGAWHETKAPAPEVQVLVAPKTDAEVQTLLYDYNNILYAQKNRVVYKNTNKCNNWYGGKCAYYGVCHKGDYSGLKNTKKKS